MNISCFFSVHINIENKRAKLLETLNISSKPRKEDRFKSLNLSPNPDNIRSNNYKTEEKIIGRENGGIKEKIRNFV
jgi:hypothetical protein